MLRLDKFCHAQRKPMSLKLCKLIYSICGILERALSMLPQVRILPLSWCFLHSLMNCPKHRIHLQKFPSVLCKHVDLQWWHPKT
ncbi:hypothetical protein OIU77_001793 [Salix suchowensis]|uniref:Uncharacterized protein n=1 Tax=Salix suchowensis TaxID=1278906 RepID=A0ABQ9B3Y9_9ROSI|nr:hypothetical protein OIU77_001793 [Salix suchowensis]